MAKWRDALQRGWARIKNNHTRFGSGFCFQLPANLAAFSAFILLVLLALVLILIWLAEPDVVDLCAHAPAPCH